MIVIDNIHKYFGGFKAVDGTSLEIKKNSITGLIGPNGAGKTTLFNVIAGIYKPTSGKVYLDHEDITDLPPHKLFEKGVLRTFQIPHEFSTMSVLENLMMVPGSQTGEKLFNTWFNTSKISDEEKEIKSKAIEVTKFLTIDHLLYEKAGNLSGGQKKLLELGRTMMVDAKLVLLDEVGAGVNKTLLKKIGQSIKTLNSELGYTFFMIEHDIDFISSLCDPVVVMTEGSVLTEGNVENIKNDDRVIEAYLGN